uniref:Lipocalin-5 1 n=1 Tax=Steinernema glaseri TaxID=37863 RepID=A0A1I8AQT0_9BILA
MLFFIFVMALICPLGALRVRYTLIAQDLIASEVDKGPVNSKSECMLLAYNVSSLAYVLVVKDGVTQCHVPGSFDGFKEKTDSKRSVFLVDTREPSDVCDDPSNIDVRTFMEGTCDAPPDMCDSLQKLRMICKEKADNAACIPPAKKCQGARANV